MPRRAAGARALGYSCMSLSLPLPQRVLHVSTVHGPHDTRIFFKEARALAASGLDVTIAGTVEERGTRDGVSFIPLGSRDGSRFRRILRDLRALSAIVSNRDAIIHIHDPELLVVAALPALAGVRVVYDVHELYTEGILNRPWIPRQLRRTLMMLYDLVERLTIPRFAGIVIAVEGFSARYERFISPERIALVRNFPNITSAEIAAARSKPHPLDGRPYVIHTGGASKQVLFHVIVATAESLRERGSDLQIVNIGEICLDEYPRDEARSLVERAKRAGVILRDRMDLIELFTWLAHARIGYQILSDTENHRKGIPNKLFEYARFGLPVVVTEIGHIGEIVRSDGFGTPIGNEDGSAHAEAMLAIHQNEPLHARLSEASLKASESYSFAGELQRLRELYARIVATQ